MVVKIHKFLTFAGATIALSLINSGEGIPKGGGSQTQTYTAIRQHDILFWYIYADVVTKKYLGQGEDFDFPPTII